ncbi:MAG: tyrosine-type recombinase/integrase [Acidimicrobiales bacterium]
MRGGLRENSPGVWEVRVEAGRDPVTGKRRQISRTVRGTKREAQRVLNALVAGADLGQGSGTKATFGQLADQWLALVDNDLSPTTLHRYRNLLKNRILPSLGKRPVHEIRARDLDRLYLALVNDVGLAPATVRQIHAIIRRALRQAVLWGWIPANPAANATPPRQTKNYVVPPDVKQVGKLLEAAAKVDAQLSRFLHIAVATGARRGEVCALRWRNLDIDQKTLSIERSITDLPGGPAEKSTKTHASRRVALDQGTLAVFEEQRVDSLALAKDADALLSQDSYIFSREPDGRVPWVPGSVTKRFQLLRDSLGYESMRLHDLRHFTATRLIAAGVPIRTVSGRLGHANPSTTLAVYAHFVEASDQAAASVMGDILTGSSRAYNDPSK